MVFFLNGITKKITVLLVRLNASSGTRISNIVNIKPPTIKRPDVNDPNFYCKICNITLNSKYLYKSHCRYVHPKIQLKSSIVRSDILSNVSDPNNYCKACEKKMASKRNYRKHLQYVHKMLNAPRFQKKLRYITLISMIPTTTVVLVIKRFPQKFHLKCILCVSIL